MNKSYHKVNPGYGIKIVLTACLMMLISAAGLTDLKAQVEQIWKIDAPESNWFLNANTERGITYNPVTGNLYIASRQGGVTPVILNAATGDSLGVLETMQPKAENVVPIWTIEAPTGGWFTDANTERGIAFNPATGNLIVASRQGGVTPVIIDAASGDSLSVLDNTDIGGGTFPFNQIRATADGQIYTANLAINQETRIYRWGDETAAPELVFADSIGGRLGDSFGVVGSGDDVTVLLSGSGSEKVVTFNWDGTSLTLANQFPVAAGEARGGFSSRTLADSVLISGTGTAPRFMNVTDGTLGTQIVSPDVEGEDLNSSMLNDLIEWNGKTLAAFGPAFTNGQFYLLDLSDGNNLIDGVGPIGSNANGNNTGGVLFDEANERLYLMDTNNAIHAYNIADFFPQPIIAGGTFPFNQISATADGQIFTANLAINAVSRIYRWESETAVPELIYADSLGQRLGDSFSLVGEGDDVTLLLSGGGAEKVSVFNWNGTELNLTNEYTIPAGAARGGFSNGTVADSVIISGTGTAPQYFNFTDGTLGSVITSPDIEAADLNSSMLNDLVTIEGRTIAAFGPAFSNGLFYIVDLSDGGALLEAIGPLGENENLNNAGGVVFDGVNNRLYLMDTNNAVVAYDISALLETGSAMANVQIIHNSSDPAAASVDIFINGELAREDINFRSATEFIELPANTNLNIVLTPADAGIEAGVEFTDNIFEAGVNYHVIASGVLDPTQFASNPDGVDTAFFLDIISGVSLSVEDEDSFSFLISHGATDAPAVDVNVRGGANLAQNLSYTDITSEYISVPTDTYTLDIAPTGNDTPVASFEADVSALGGSTAIVLASGFLTPDDDQDGEPFGLLLVLTDGTTAMLPTMSTSVDDQISGLPQQFELNQNYPNPFNPSTKIEYSLPQAANVQISVYNVMGQQVATLINNEKQSAGYHTISFDAGNLASGMYLYRIQAGSFVQTRKMTLIK